MGWNNIRRRAPCPLLEGIAEEALVYFVHSYFVVPRDRSVVATETDYPTPFVSSVQRGRLFATQFHPEKSQEVGLALLRNFAQIG